MRPAWRLRPCGMCAAVACVCGCIFWAGPGLVWFQGCLGAASELKHALFLYGDFFFSLALHASLPPSSSSPLRRSGTSTRTSRRQPTALLSIALLLWVTSVCQIPLLPLLCTSTSPPSHPITLASLVFVSRPPVQQPSPTCPSATRPTSYSIFATSGSTACSSRQLD